MTNNTIITVNTDTTKILKTKFVIEIEPRLKQLQNCKTTPFYLISINGVQQPKTIINLQNPAGYNMANSFDMIKELFGTEHAQTIIKYFNTKGHLVVTLFPNGDTVTDLKKPASALDEPTATDFTKTQRYIQDKLNENFWEIMKNRSI